MHRWAMWGAAMFVGGWVGTARAQATPPRLVVMNLDAPGIDASQRTALGEYLLTELQATNLYTVTGGSDVQVMLDAEAQRQMMGCDDRDCLAQIAGALNAELLASGNVGKLGEGFLVNLKIIRVRDNEVVARASVRADADGDPLMQAMRVAVRTVTATNDFTDALPQITVLPVALWGGAAAALATGIGFGVKAQGHYRDFNDITYLDVDGAARAGKQSQIIADVAFGAALLSAVAGALVWWLSGTEVEVIPDATPSTDPHTAAQASNSPTRGAQP